MGGAKDCDATKEKGKFFRNDFLHILMQDMSDGCYLVLNFSQGQAFNAYILAD